MKEPANILEVAALAPDFLGFIFYRKSKRYVDGLSAEFVHTLPPSIKKAGVFVDEELDELVKHVAIYGLDAVQLHGAESADYCRELRPRLPAGTVLIKAFGVDENFDFSLPGMYVDFIDYFLFDTQTPDHGGSGKVFNWKLLDKYTLDKPYLLSGGIGPESITEIVKINDERLYAIDVNSRFELEPGLKDIDKLNDFKNRLPL
ncbi:MAG TPA: phosphoribosylanthranilate isomerase [Pedobacter sp.]|nr:phosphoribosylanthranilate isomerase [Pedobacter sp.]